MPANVTVALQRFRRRLRLRALTAGASIAATWLGAGGAAALVAMHLTDRGLPAWLTSSWRGPVALLVGVLVAALLWGWFRAARTRVGHAELCEHLEQRLGTGSLLLVAGEGVTLPEPYDRQLAAQLQQLHAALPPVGFAPRVQRPALALLLLAGATLLPAPALRNGGGAAATAAVGKLEQRVAALAADPRVPDDVREDLQAAVHDLERRAELGADNLWREIDQLTERVDREVAGLAAGAASGAAGAGPDAAGAVGGAMTGAGVGVAELREQVRQLSAADRLLRQAGRSPETAGGLSEQAQALLDAARDERGDVDASRLAADPRLTAQVAEQLAAELAAALQAAAAAGADPAFAEQAAQLAAALEAAAPQEASRQLSREELQDLMQSVAEGVSALAELSGSFDGLADMLQGALGSGAAELAAQALQQVDAASLMALLPDDPQQLQALAQRLGELARAAAQSSSSSSPSSSSAPSSSSGAAGDAAAAAANGMSAEQRAQLQQLAERLAGATDAARHGGGQPGGATGGNGAEAAGGFDGQGAPGRGPGHAALRMTERAAGEANGELELPTPIDPGQLSREWRPMATQKAAPEVGAPHDVAPGGDPAAGGGGVATWQLRVMPRHRAAVQRFFGGGDSPPPATGGARGSDKK